MCPWGHGLSVAGGLVTTEPHQCSLSLLQWDLVCDSNKLKEMAQSDVLAGTLPGGILLGSLSAR